MSRRKGRAYCSPRNEQYEDVVSALKKISFVERLSNGVNKEKLDKNSHCVGDVIQVTFKLSNKGNLVQLRNALNDYISNNRP
jgi:hypothetical protein